METSSIASASVQRRVPTTREGATNVLALLAAHGALASFFAVACLAPFGLALLPLAPLACVLHQKATSEWLHEAAHWNFLPSRAWNDRVAQALAAVFFLDDVEEHRRKHFTHHQRRGFFVDEDLDTAELAVRTRRDVVRGVLRDLFGLTAIAAILERNDASRARPVTRSRRYLRNVLIGIVAYALGTLALVHAIPSTPTLALPAWAPGLVYLSTLATLYPLFNRLRVYAQHAELSGGRAIIENSTAARTIQVDRLALLDRILVSSKVMLFHAEHHKHPTLPYRQLEEVAVPSEDINAHANSRLALLSRLYRALPR